MTRSSPSLNATDPTGAHAPRPVVQIAAAGVGVVFLLAGIAGFIPGLTQNLGDLQFAGHSGHAMLFGIFHVSVLHNVVHLLFGVAGVLLARRQVPSRHFLLWGGLFYVLLFVVGMFVPEESAANVVPLNAADNWLHLGLGVLMVGLSLLPRREIAATDVLGPAAET